MFSELVEKSSFSYCRYKRERCKNRNVYVGR